MVVGSVLVVSVDYNGGNISTYSGIRIKGDNGQVERVNTGNFDDDFNTIVEKYKDRKILCSSTVDHFIMDRKAAQEN